MTRVCIRICTLVCVCAPKDYVVSHRRDCRDRVQMEMSSQCKPTYCWVGFPVVRIRVVFACEYAQQQHHQCVCVCVFVVLTFDEYGFPRQHRTYIDGELFPFRWACVACECACVCVLRTIRTVSHNTNTVQPIKTQAHTEHACRR